MGESDKLPVDLCDWSLRQRMAGWVAWSVWRVLHIFYMGLLPWAGAFAYANREEPEG